MVDRFFVYATFDAEKAFVHSFVAMPEADRLRGQLNRRYASNGMLAIATILPHEPTIAWSVLKLRLIGGEQTREKRCCYGVLVSGTNSRWLKRLHSAGLDYDPIDQSWFLGALTYQQAKSLTGRMREIGLKVNLTGLTRQTAVDQPYKPTAHDSVVAKQADHARRLINRSSAGKGHRARHNQDSARRSFETATAGMDNSKSTP